MSASDDLTAKYARLAESQGVAWQAQHGGNPHLDHDLPNVGSEPEGGNGSCCRSCDAAIRWGETAKGKRCPFDVETGESHFRTCPDSGRWSTPKRG